jgi:hypothetical protein
MSMIVTNVDVIKNELAEATADEQYDSEEYTVEQDNLAADEVAKVKAERLTPEASQSSSYGDADLNAEVRAIVTPHLYDIATMPADEERIAALLADEERIAKVMSRGQ